MSERVHTDSDGSDAAALDAAARALGLRLVVRFGSRASRSALPPRPESDLDLAVLAGTQHVSAVEAVYALADAFPHHDLDVAVLNRADPLFRGEVLLMGDLLWGDADVFAEEQARAYRMVEDDRQMRTFEARLVRKKTDALLARRRHAAT